MKIKSPFIQIFLLFQLLSLYSLTSISAQPDPEALFYEELSQDYVPQDTPEKSYQLELKIMLDSMYCFDLPLFDPAWRKRGHKILTQPGFVEAAQTFKKSFQTYVKDQSAVIYYPENFNLNPIFLYQENGKWVIDRTAVEQYIRFDSSGVWIALDSDYPYIQLLKDVFELKSVSLNESLKGFSPVKIKK